MSWIKKDFPTIPGYESLGDDVEAKRWCDFVINQLLDTGDPLWEFRGKLKTRQAICDFVIVEFDYPFHFGLPTDKHLNNWFHGGCCHQITLDMWQLASETLQTLVLNQRKGKKGIGDCEDVAGLFTTLFLEKKWPAYMCLGLVLQDNNILGGHGWPIWKDENGLWRLYEATLDIPPEYPDGYPVINPDENSWQVNGLTYLGEVKFSRKEYYESGEADMIAGLLKLGVAMKETRRKYKAISKAWHQKAKPLKKLTPLARLRWK